MSRNDSSVAIHIFNGNLCFLDDFDGFENFLQIKSIVIFEIIENIDPPSL